MTDLALGIPPDAGSRARSDDLLTGDRTVARDGLAPKEAPMRTRISSHVTGAALVAALAVALGQAGSLAAEPATRPSRPHALTAVGRTLYFFANDGVHGDELWRSDGTRTGTRMVADLRPGAGPARAGVWETAVLGHEFYFTVDDGVHGFELWRSDGTRTGTGLVRDIRTGSEGSYPYDLTV